MSTRILVVNSQPILLEGIKAILETEIGFKIIEGSESFVTNDQQIEELHPDIVLMDISKCEEECLKVLKKSYDTTVKTIAITDDRAPANLGKLIELGINGFVLKDSISEFLIPALNKANDGGFYLPPSYEKKLADKRVNPVRKEKVIPTILNTKLHPPYLTKDQVIRTIIIGQLEKNIEKPLSLVSAPAGYGKSQTVSQWLKESMAKSCWISLDDEHNDLRVFLNYLIAAFEKMIKGSLAQTNILASASELPQVSTIATSIINELDDIEENFILVLDDYHRINEEDIHLLMDEILKYPPQGLHISLLTRRDPPLKINNLLAKNRMIEVRMKDLAFSEEEIIELFENSLNLRIKANTANILKFQTEGWIVALRMASFLIENIEEADDVLSHFHGDMNSMSKYLLEEILMKQPQEFQNLLLKSSILNRFNAEIIDSLIEDEMDQQINGSNFIKWLLKSNLFIIPLDFHEKWFRFHHLIQDFLQGILQAKIPAGLFAQSHEKASLWFEEHGFIEEAIQHMLSAGNDIGAANIVERHRKAELDRDKWYVVHRWLKKLPEDQKQRPDLLLSETWAAYENFHLEQIPVLLEKVKKQLGDPGDIDEMWGEWHLLYGLFHHWCGESKIALDHFEKSRKYLPNDESLSTGMVDLHIALARGATGRYKLAVEDCSKQLRESKADPVYKTRLFAGLYYNHQFAGDLIKAKSESQNAIRIGESSGIIYTLAMSYCMKATTCFCAYHMDEALALFQKVQQHRYIIHKATSVDALAGKVIAHQLMNQQEEADKSLAFLEKFVNELNEAPYMVIAESCKARLALLQNDVSSAMKWQSTLQGEPFYAGLFIWLEVPLITQVRVLIAAGSKENLRKAEGLIDNLLLTSTKFHMVNQTIEILVLKSVLLVKAEEQDRCREVLREVIALAEPGKWIRPFVEAGKEMLLMLQELQIQQKPTPTAFINDLLAALKGYFRLDEDAGVIMRQGTKDSSIQIKGSQEEEPISKREQEIIILLSEGFRNKEIAHKLYVSEGTVKKHIYNIGQKWNLHNRIHIIQRARELQYL